MRVEQLRESAEENNRPTPHGNFDGVSRRSLLAQLLLTHEEAERKAPYLLPWRTRFKFMLKRAVPIGIVLRAVLLVTLTASSAAAQVEWKGPRLEPQEAADILARSPSIVNVANWPSPVLKRESGVIPSQPGALSWMTFPERAPRRRLDGTLLSDPITVYGGRYEGLFSYPRVQRGQNYSPRHLERMPRRRTQR